MRCLWINLHYLILHKQIEKLVSKLPVQAVLNRQVYSLRFDFKFLGLGRLVVLLFLFVFLSLKKKKSVKICISITLQNLLYKPHEHNGRHVKYAIEATHSWFKMFKLKTQRKWLTFKNFAF